LRETKGKENTTFKAYSSFGELLGRKKEVKK